ncbi:MAG: hypothetical protein FP815_12780 [Desulfobulbaceae bacterium]|nr:hypothetical protein [Desulfobulbaceae bacterium]
MPYPPLVTCLTEAEYQVHFERMYCRGPINTFDGIAVRFNKRDFLHAFFESVYAKDDTFSIPRAERIEWIRATLQDPDSDRYVGWDSSKKRYDNNRRVTVVKGDYVVVIAIKSNGSGRFITAYVADSGRTISMIRKSPKWAKKTR